MRRWLIAAVAVGLIAGGAALALAQEPGDEVDPQIVDGTAQRELDVARERWRAAAIRSYRFKVRRECFCTERSTRPALIVVRRGKPIDPPRRLREVATVPRLFRRVQHAIDDRVASLTVRYGRRGVPREVSVDTSRMIADEEVAYVVGWFRAISP